MSGERRPASSAGLLVARSAHPRVADDRVLLVEVVRVALLEELAAEEDLRFHQSCQQLQQIQDKKFR